MGYHKTSWKDLAANPAYSFQDYLTEYGKEYPTTELYLKREKAFLANLAKIRAHNSDNSQTYKLGLNEYADWTPAEFKWKHSGVKGGLKKPNLQALNNLQVNAPFPTSLDWRTKGMVTPVKNQAACGSCWAFSAVETLESHAAISTGKLIDLGPQQIVSCAPNPLECGGTGGCQGATQEIAYNYTMSAGGLTAEKDYPYTSGSGLSGKCHTDKIKPAVNLHGYVDVTPNNYTALMAAVNLGPVAITADAGAWQLYESGIFSRNCGYEIDHGIQLVGYGEEGSQLYWIVRNSWGPSWGEAGYIRIVRYGEGKEPCGIDHNTKDGLACKGHYEDQRYCGECAILSSSSYPTGVYVL